MTEEDQLDIEYIPHIARINKITSNMMAKPSPPSPSQSPPQPSHELILGLWGKTINPLSRVKYIHNSAIPTRAATAQIAANHVSESNMTTWIAMV